MASQPLNQYVAVVLINNSKVLMQLRDNNPNIYEPNRWSLPGGKVEASETLKEAALCEFKKETGYLLNNPELVETIHMPYEKGDYDWYIFTENYDNHQKINCLEGQRMEFLSIPELRTLDVARKNLEVLKKLL